MNSDHPTVPTLELPGVPAINRPRAGTANIAVDLDQLLDWVQADDLPERKENALEQLAVHEQLADNDVVELVIGDRLNSFRHSVDFPWQHLRVLFRRNGSLRPQTLSVVETFLHHHDAGVRAMAIRVLAKHQAEGQTDDILEQIFRCGIDGELDVQIAVAEAGQFFVTRPLRAACNLISLAQDARAERTKTPEQHPIRQACFNSLRVLFAEGGGHWATAYFMERADFLLNAARSCHDHDDARKAAEQAFGEFKRLPAFRGYAMGGAS